MQATWRGSIRLLSIHRAHVPNLITSGGCVIIGFASSFSLDMNMNQRGGGGGGTFWIRTKTIIKQPTQPNHSSVPFDLLLED